MAIKITSILDIAPQIEVITKYIHNITENLALTLDL